MRTRCSLTITLICLAETIFWIAVLSSASTTTDIQPVQAFLVREQLNHSALPSPSSLVTKPLFVNPVETLERISARLNKFDQLDLRRDTKPTSPAPARIIQRTFEATFETEAKEEEDGGASRHNFF